MQMSVGRRWQDVELFAPVGAVAVAEQSQVFEHVECPVDRRWDCGRVDLPAAFDELRPRHVAVRARQHLDESASLWGPAQAARPETVANIRPVRPAMSRV